MAKTYVLQKRTESTFFNVGVTDDIDFAIAWVEKAWVLGYRRYDVFEFNEVKDGNA